MRRIGVLIWKELIELRHDPRLFFIVLIAPVMQLLVLGNAANTDVRNVPVIIADADRSSESRALIARIEASPSFTVLEVVAASEVDDDLEEGVAWMALSIPAGFEQSLRTGTTTKVQVVADGSDANSAGVAMSYISALVSAHAQDLAAGARDVVPQGGAALRAGGQGGLEPRVRVWFNPRLLSRDFMIPGILAVLLLVVTTTLSSMAIVREKELGTLEQLHVTPLGRLELIVGKLVPYALIGAIDVGLVIVVSVYGFEVPLRGSVPLLLAMSGLYLLATLALGLFVSTISSTQQQAMMTSTFFFMLPMVLLSGFVFPIENMPAVVQPATYLIPLRYYLVILRAIFLKGVGFDVLWPQAAALAAWGVVVLTLAVARSSKRAA